MKLTILQWQEQGKKNVAAMLTDNKKQADSSLLWRKQLILKKNVSLWLLVYWHQSTWSYFRTVAAEK